MPNMARKPVKRLATVSGSRGARGRLTPLGLPVVPDV
jgi:hypothetical protein